MELGNEQKDAVKAIINFFENSKETAFLLQGPGGTGKTTISKEVCNYLDKKGVDYVLTAPTHKAKLVLSRASDMPAMTIHKLFSLRPEIEIWNFDARDLKFVSGVPPTIPYKGLIICDEGSMINDFMFDFLLTKCLEYKCKILFMADKAQLSPVQSKSTYSKIFEVKEQFTLTKIYRQDSENAIAPILVSLREKPIRKLESKKGNSGSLYCTEDIKIFLALAKQSFTKAIENKDILHTKITAFTNERVKAYNDTMRRIIYNDSNEYHIGEFLTAYDNIKNDWVEIWNSMDYIIQSIVETEINIPYFGYLPAWNLTLFDSATNENYEINILKREIPEKDLIDLADKIDFKRKDALSAKANGNRRSAGYKWKQFYEMIGSFSTPYDIITSSGSCMKRKTFDYGYACTTHKLQGSTLDNIFIDLKNFNVARDEESKRQLQYVALSRTKSDAVILQ